MKRKSLIIGFFLGVFWSWSRPIRYTLKEQFGSLIIEMIESFTRALRGKPPLEQQLRDEQAKTRATFRHGAFIRSPRNN